MDRKKRLLICNEASFLNTGFSVFSQKLLQNLYGSGKYEIAELACYASPDDPRCATVPWKIYPVMPSERDENAKRIYHSSNTAQFGEAIFESVCNEFRPDIVLDTRDRWMCEYQLRSPARPHYKILWMPTVDGRPQKPEWLDDYSQADAILTYSEFGKQTLEEEAPGRIPIVGVVKPGVDHKVFQPVKNRLDLRKKIGIDENSKIIMTIMRNQPRKLFPDLMDAFNIYLAECVKNNNIELAQTSYLYLHTSYPDVGYDLSKHILSKGLSHKILVTHVCQRCRAFYPTFFSGELSPCKKCGALAAIQPNTGFGVSREQLAILLNLADVYVQYATCEGLGMGQCEAKACAIPALAVDYSAMAEQTREPGGIPIEVERYFYEYVTETEQRRALPNNKDCAKKLYNILSLPEEARRAIGIEGQKFVVENYSFEKAIRVFQKTIDEIDISTNKPWDAPASPSPLKRNPPMDLSNSEFIDWCINNVYGKPELIQSYFRADILKALNIGKECVRGGYRPINRDWVFKKFYEMGIRHNNWEATRLAAFKPRDKYKPSWIAV